MERIKRLPYFGASAILVYMPLHIFLSQWLSTATGGLDAWKVAKDFLTIALLVISVISLWYFKKAGNKIFRAAFGLAAVYALLHLAVFFFNRYSAPVRVALLAFAYNNRLLWYLLIGQSAALLWPKINQNKVTKIVLAVSTIVGILAVAQFLLPKDIMANFGYALERGVKPAFFIDDKGDLPRAFSTLRDPNSLGAYLILPLVIIVQRAFKQKDKMLYGGLFGIHALALLLTFSRSAWLGAVLSTGFLLGYLYKEQSINFLKKYAWVFALGVLLLAGSVYVLRGQYFVENVLFHADENTVEAGSSEKHIAYTRAGIKGIINNPLGHGPGTAGLVSIQNPNGGLLTENYFLQIGYEIGLIGLAVFVAANIFVYKKLVSLQSELAACLLASFWGYVLTNMLLHTWSNEAVAAQWWLLAGTVMLAKSQESSAGGGGKAARQFA